MPPERAPHQPARCIPDPESVHVSPKAWMGGDPTSVGILPIGRHKVFDFGKNKGVKIKIMWELLLGLPRNGGQRWRPAEAKRAVSNARVVVRGELRIEAGAAGVRGDGHGHRAGPSNQIGGELLAYAPNCPAILW